MGQAWFEPLRPRCEEAAASAGSPFGTDVVLFYLARWCQKSAGRDEPDPTRLAPDELERATASIARNLAQDGPTVESLVRGETAPWTALRRILVASSSGRPRAGPTALEYAEEALQRIALVLLTGTPPSRAAEQLERGPSGPGNEFVFHAPFDFWARSIVIHLIVDDLRREARERRPPPERPPRGVEPLDRSIVTGAGRSLPGLVEAIRGLPKVQRSVFVLSLSRTGVDQLVRERLCELAPDLFDATADPPSSDRDIAERLGTTPHLVAANRSAARRKLARRDHGWAVLLDALLPHRSTRPLAGRGAGAGRTTDGSEASGG